MDKIDLFAGVSLGIVLACASGSAAVAAGTSDQPTGSATEAIPMARIHEVDLLIVADKRILQVGGYGEDAAPSIATGEAPRQAQEAQQAEALRPLQPELTIDNTEAQLVESLRKELGDVGVKVRGVTIREASGSMLDRQALADLVGPTPHTSGLLVVVPTIALSGDYRKLLVDATVWVLPRDSNDAVMVSTFFVPSDPLVGPDPVGQWSSAGGARFFHALGVAEVDLGHSVAGSFRQAALERVPPDRGGEPPGWHQDIPSGPVSIEGVAVSGHIDTVSVADIAQTITAFKDIGLRDLAALTVVSKDEIHGYTQDRDLGWLTAKRTIFDWVDKSQHPGWYAYGQGLPDFSAALDCIRAAQQVYVFPVTTSLDPHRDDKHMRLLDAEARSRLAGILGPKEDWFVGFNNLIYPEKEPTNVGFVFRNGGDELVLFFVHEDVVVGTFNGQHLSGTLNDLSGDKIDKRIVRALEQWKVQYAQPELTTPAKTPAQTPST